jgi:hypothetical protein
MDALVTKYSFFCFCATLAAIVLLYSLGALLAWSGRPAEALGIGGAGTGLIGILGGFKPRSSPMMHPAPDSQGTSP